MRESIALVHADCIFICFCSCRHVSDEFVRITPHVGKCRIAETRTRRHLQPLQPLHGGIQHHQLLCNSLRHPGSAQILMADRPDQVESHSILTSRDQPSRDQQALLDRRIRSEAACGLSRMRDRLPEFTERLMASRQDPVRTRKSRSEDEQATACVDCGFPAVLLELPLRINPELCDIWRHGCL